MKISKSSWHYRFLQRTHNTWLKGYSDFDPEEYNNLCPYLRAIFIYAPITWIGGPIYKAIFFLFKITQMTATSIIDWIYWQYAKRTYIIIDGKIVEVTEFHDAEQYPTLWHKLRIKAPKEKKPKTGTPIQELLLEWLEARHDKVCPTIEFVSTEKPIKP